MSSPQSYKNVSLEEIIIQLGVSKSMIRFWEDEFELPKRDNGTLQPLEIAQICLINTLIKEKGMTLEDAKKEFLFQQKSMIERYNTIETLQNIKQKLILFKEKL
jgi:DNA-binding transcriptional MerR regulator